MGWQDRPYSGTPQRGGFGGSFGGGNFDWKQLFFGSVYIGAYSGIAVRVHCSLLWLGALSILFSGARGGMGLQNAIVSTLLIFGIVLLHEFGHCFAARRVGGDAREILLWPLGGLAFVSTPRRPWPSFVAAAGGPLVNVVLCVVSGGILMALSGGQFSLPLNPLIPFGGEVANSAANAQLFQDSTIAYYLWWLYIVSWALLFFNLLPIFPLDGGQILQAILWQKFGYYRSMNFACTTGMIGAAIMGLVGLITMRFLLCFLAYAGFMTCRMMQMNLREYADSAWDPPSPAPRRARRSTRPRDDKFTIRDLNPFERIARYRRKKQFERLMRDD